MPHYLVVDVGGTKILGAALNESGEILSRHKLRTERGDRAALLKQLDIALDAVLAGAGLQKSDISGLALGIPGVVDSARGHVVLTPNAPLSDTPLAEIMSGKWNCPILIGNDVNVGMAGEVWRGAARGAQSAFGIFVGTGIGGGLFLDGKLIEGFRGLGGEIGHFLVPLGAEEKSGAPIKGHTFLEELCSRTAIENQLRHAIQVEGRKSILSDIVAEKGDKNLERIRSGAIKEALKKKDPLTEEVVRRASHLLGLASASVLHLIDPQVIVFGGGVIEACGKWMLPQIQKTVQKVAMPGTGKPVEIKESVLGDDAILMGGLYLLLEREKHSGGRKVPVFASVDKPLQS